MHGLDFSFLLTFLGSTQSLRSSHLYIRTPTTSILFSLLTLVNLSLSLSLFLISKTKINLSPSDFERFTLSRTWFHWLFFKKMRSVDRYRHHHPSLHLPLPHIHHHHHQDDERQEEDNLRDVPRGCLAVSVGQGEDQRRFVIPVAYVNHPLFVDLLREAEDEYEFDQKGPINIPCHVDDFRNVQNSIDREASKSHRHDHHHSNIHRGCFGLA